MTTRITPRLSDWHASQMTRLRPLRRKALDRSPAPSSRPAVTTAGSPLTAD